MPDRTGIAFASPRSGEGKTTVTLGVLAALRRSGAAVQAAKSGPDYIDAQFLAAATGTPCLSLDSWAMEPDRLRALAGSGEGLLVVEGAMGLHDGAPDAADPFGRGSTAELALALDLPVILVLDVSRQAQTAAAVAKGLAEFRSGIEVRGAILNRVASRRHERTIRRSFAASGMPVLGAIPRREELSIPSRHLGLVQPGECGNWTQLLDAAAAAAEEHVDLVRVREAAAPLVPGRRPESLPPLGQRIAVARDDAFSFLYEHHLRAWREAGAEIRFFSPLEDESPASDSDSVFLPGGYPELHAGRLGSRSRFRAGMRAAAARSATVYGECGGYMALGRALTDRRGDEHPMLGLLPVDTSIASPRMTLGYRLLRPHPNPLWPDSALAAHEFHYASEIPYPQAAEPLFSAWDSEGNPLPDLGLRRGRVMGSFAHVIDRK